jgi:hypothetical protein
MGFNSVELSVNAEAWQVIKVTKGDKSVKQGSNLLETKINQLLLFYFVVADNGDALGRCYADIILV